MYIIVILLSVWIFVRTISYGIYEIKQEQNKIGGTFVIVLSVIALILPIVIVILRGIY